MKRERNAFYEVILKLLVIVCIGFTYADANGSFIDSNLSTNYKPGDHSGLKIKKKRNFTNHTSGNCTIHDGTIEFNDSQTVPLFISAEIEAKDCIPQARKISENNHLNEDQFHPERQIPPPQLLFTC